MKINQNISAVIVNDQLLRNENSVAASVKRLSSGLKFNDAKDNPSGMAISFKMQAQINALNRASLNATDGTSMVETIDGAMGEMTEVLQRIRELCVQAANDTNGKEDREAIQQEIDALKEEINRISSATEFNGKTLLDGSLDRRTYVTAMETQANGTQKKVSMFDKITNVIISDELQAGDYKVEIIEPARHAVIKPEPESKPIPGGGTVVTEDMEGIVCINGAKAEIKAGMTADDVYQAIRDAGDMGWVNVLVTDGTQAADTDFDESCLDSQGYVEEKEGYVFGGKKLAFVSQNYGTDETITLTCDNANLADVLGIADIGKIVEKTSRYSIEEEGDTVNNIPASFLTAVPDQNYLDASGNIKESGTIYINGFAAEISAGMTPAQAYTALKDAADKGKVNLKDTAGADLTTIDFTKPMKFEMQNSNGKCVIEYENENLGKLFGLTPAKEEILSIQYKVEAEGSDANVSIKETVNGNTVNRQEYTGQAVVKTTGNQVVITDKSGFEMSFEVRGDVAYGNKDSVEITIEATDIGTLQLQIGANENQELAVRVPILNTQSLYMDDLDVRKSGGADRGMDAMDTAIGIVTAARSLMGAYENRLDYVKSGLDATEEDMTTAISRLGDVDMAQEMTEYTNANVLTQASISVLSQANDLPQQVLSLLQ